MKSRLGSNSKNNWRLKTSYFITIVLLIIIQTRLFYWQIIRGEELKQQANKQAYHSLTIRGQRGTIYTADQHLLVGNEQKYKLYVQPHYLDKKANEIKNEIIDILLNDNYEYQSLELVTKREEFNSTFEQQLIDKLESEKKWIKIAENLSEESKQKILDKQIKGLHLISYYQRVYPEASMASHITGFVGQDNNGMPYGYYGIEGALNEELKAKTKKVIYSPDEKHNLFTSANFINTQMNGRKVILTLERNIQRLAEDSLIKGIERYQAKSGSIIIMNPKTGDIIAAASYPNYIQKIYSLFEPNLYSNPSLSEIYEPGSTFKALTVATGLDLGVISPNTQCDKCSSARIIDGYTIKTWNDTYHPNITIKQGLIKSDNTAMIFAAEKIGIENLKKYLLKFGISKPINIDLQADNETPFPQQWNHVKLATVSFGQGISTTDYQLIRAINVLANQGKIINPKIVKKVIDPVTNEEITTPHHEEVVISEKTAQIMTNLLEQTADDISKNWNSIKQYSIAGKTGTSQIPGPNGYIEDKTIASFIGYAPASNPQFIMLVRLNEPQSSEWAATTAAPLWYEIAKQIFLMKNIAPDR